MMNALYGCWAKYWRYEHLCIYLKISVMMILEQKDRIRYLKSLIFVTSHLTNATRVNSKGWDDLGFSSPDSGKPVLGSVVPVHVVIMHCLPQCICCGVWDSIGLLRKLFLWIGYAIKLSLCCMFHTCFPAGLWRQSFWEIWEGFYLNAFFWSTRGHAQEDAGVQVFPPWCKSHGWDDPFGCSCTLLYWSYRPIQAQPTGGCGSDFIQTSFSTSGMFSISF